MEGKDSNIYIRALGNAPFIGKSCIFVDIPDVCSFILDYGCAADANNFKPVELDKKFTHGHRQVNPLHDADFMFISHAHQDHAGGLVKCAFQKPIYASKLTSAQFPRAQAVNFYQRNYVNSSSYFVMTPAGHIPGAAIFTFVSPRVTVVYTGDYELTESFLLQSCQFPQEAINCDVFICETTFGQIITRDEHYQQLQHFQMLALCHAANRACIHPVGSTGQAQTMAIQINQFASRLGQTGYELVTGQVRQMMQLFCESQDLNLNYGLYLKQVFVDYKQFNARRTIVLSAPQRLSGGTTLDLVFEQMEKPGSVLVLSGNCNPGQSPWKWYNGVVTECRRDNAKVFIQNKLRCEVLSYSSHADFVDLARVLTHLKPRLLVGTHCAKLDSLDVVDKLLSCVLPKSRFVVLSQQVITVKTRTQMQNGFKGKVFRTQLKMPVQQALDRLLEAGIVMQQRDNYWQCGGLLVHQDGIVAVCNGVAGYQKALELMGIDYMLAKSL